MKRLLAILICILLILCASGCSSGEDQSAGSGSSAAANDVAPAPKVADDTSVLGMSFTPPAGYSTVTRFVESRTDGSFSEKDIFYNYDEDTEIRFAAVKGYKVEDVMKTEGKETMQAGGATFYLQTSDSSSMAFAEYDGALYGIRYAKSETAVCPTFEEVMQGISFAAAADTLLNEDEESIGAIRYTLDSTKPIAGRASAVTEKPDGTPAEKYCIWRFGEDAEKVDYSLMIELVKDATVEEETKEYLEKTSYTIGSKELNGLSFTTVTKGDEDAPYAYYVQHGGDVYRVSNSGSNNGLWTTRSEESVTAFEALLNTISFQD